jgi:hypothetical protein
MIDVERWSKLGSARSQGAVLPKLKGQSLEA